jgi:hypothetical protein
MIVGEIYNGQLIEIILNPYSFLPLRVFSEGVGEEAIKRGNSQRIINWTKICSQYPPPIIHLGQGETFLINLPADGSLSVIELIMSIGRTLYINQMKGIVVGPSQDSPTVIRDFHLERIVDRLIIHHLP